jgi:hypothetical protein
MATTSVEIVNSALNKIGARRITSLSDGSKAAIIANDQYDRLRKEVLRSHPWNFAIAYAQLAATVNTPIWTKQWTKEFVIPTDVLRVLETDLTSDADWELGNNTDNNKVIFTNSTSLKIKYIKDITNTTRFDAMFDEALAMRIAADLAYPLVQSQTVQQNMFNAYLRFMADARTMDAQENALDTVESDTFTIIRG